MKILTHDTVIIRTGKDRGKTGVVTKILKDKVVVEGINKAIKHVKGREGRPGERIEFFAPIHVSNIALVDPKNGKATRVGYRLEGKQKTRISRRSGEVILPGTKPKKEKKNSTPHKKTKA